MVALKGYIIVNRNQPKTGRGTWGFNSSAYMQLHARPRLENELGHFETGVQTHYVVNVSKHLSSKHSDNGK